MFNNYILMGRLTHPPKLKATPNGNNVVKFSLAVGWSKTTTDGEKQTDFIDCVAWNKTAEFICKYFKKGEPIIVEGRLETRQYEDKQGNKRKASEVIVREVNFCASKNNKDEQSEQKTELPKEDDLLEYQDLPF